MEPLFWTVAPCRVIPCICDHDYQDRRYGPGKRVHNPAKPKGGGTTWRCTVCARLKGE